MISYTFLKQLVDNFFSDHEISLLSQAITESYARVSYVNANGPLMGPRCPAGRKIKPFSYYLEVEASIDKLCSTGSLSCKSEWKEIARNGDRYLLLSKKIMGYTVQMTINQTKTINEVSRPAECRKSMNHNTQLSLFDDDDLDTKNPSKVYLELNHGYEGLKPRFIMLGLPTKDGTWVVKKVLPLEQKETTIEKNTLSMWNAESEKQSVGFTPDELVNNTKKQEKNG